MSQQVEPHVTVACHCPVVYVPPCNAMHIRAGSLEPVAPATVQGHAPLWGHWHIAESDSESSGTSTSASSATSTSASSSPSSSTSSTSSTSFCDNYDTAMGWPIIQAVSLLYMNHYLSEHWVIKKCGSYLHMMLNVWRTEWPEIFQRHLRMWPEVFNALLSAIHHDNIFSNSSNWPQGTTFHSTLQDGASQKCHSYGWCITLGRQGYGTVDWCTWHVFIALLWEPFQKACVNFPSIDSEESEAGR